MFEKMKSPMFWVSILGALKIFSDAIGYNLIDDKQINALSDGIATILTLIGVYMNHDKPVVPVQQQEEQQQ